MISCDFCKIFKKTFVIEHFGTTVSLKESYSIRNKTKKSSGDLLRARIGSLDQTGNYMFKVNNINTRSSCEIIYKTYTKTWMVEFYQLLRNFSEL